MALPKGWVAAGQEVSSGQAWVHPVQRAGADDRRFALKRLKNPKRRDRFVREVLTMDRLRKERGVAVPPIVASDLKDDRPWFVMPWYEDGSLQARVDTGAYRDDLRGGLELLIALARIVADVHAANVAHRDLKPANVLVDGGDLMLCDFGLCLDAGEPDPRLTASGEAIGSRLYIAPENEDGINEGVDQIPADFYAFGKVAWALLVGVNPPGRERQTQPENRLVARLDLPDFAALDTLLADLIEVDPRARLREWTVVTDELRATIRTLDGLPSDEIRTSSERARRAAERLGSLTTVQKWRDAENAERRRQAWVGGLLNSMLDRARIAERALDDLRGLVAEYLTLSVTNGGAPPSWLLALSEAEPLGMDPASEVLLPTAGASDAAVVFLIHSPRAIEAFPTLVIRVWCITEQDAVSIARLPTIQRSPEPERIADFLSQSLVRTFGPYPAFRQTTVDRATAIVEETARIFVMICETYLTIVGEERDPADPGSWPAHELVPAAFLSATEPAHDVEPPSLRSFTLTPEHVRLSRGGEVVCRARIVDSLAGNAGAGYSSSPSQALLVSESGQTKFAMLDQNHLISGDPLDGIYEDRLVFEQAAERGRWRVQHVMLVDQVGNTRTYDTAQLADLGFTHSIRLI